jgi:transposase
MFPYVDGNNNREAVAELLRQLEQVIAELRTANAQLQAENAELRARIEELEKAQAPAKREKAGFVKPDRPKRVEGQARKKRAKGFARKRDQPTHKAVHAVARCEACDCTLGGGSVKRRRQVLHIPLVPIQVIEHLFVERRCPLCGRRYVPKAKEVLRDIVGRHRLSISTMAWIATLREVGHLPIETIRWYLQTFHALTLSVGEIVDVLHAVAREGEPDVQKLQEELQHSAVVHGDETTWREDGQNGYFWHFGSPTIRYFLYRHSRSGQVVNEVLGPDFDGALVSDFYSGYSRMLGRHQRCWAHLLRDIHECKEKHPADQALDAWAKQVHALYLQARTYARSDPVEPAQKRQTWQHQFEQELSALCQPYLQTDSPQRTLCKRVDAFLPELFTFVADPRVPPDNNLAERAIRPFVVARKISGGTRSEQGSHTKSILATLFGTWLLRGINAFAACADLLIPP